MKHVPKARAGRWLIATGGLAVVWLGGCSTPLFTPDEPRSQYDRIDRVRDRRAATYYYDHLGDRKPNLRQRVLSAE